MPIARVLYEELISLQAVLRDARLPSDELPPRNAMNRMFAFWFAMQAFRLMQFRDELQPQRRDEPIPESLVRGMGRFSTVLRKVLGFPMPEPAKNTSLATASTFFSMGASGLAGDNWCRHSADLEIPMQIHRNMNPASPELEMTCLDGHHTAYDDGSGSTPMLKV